MNDQPCSGIPFTLQGMEITPGCYGLFLAHAVQCPLCDEWVTRWLLEGNQRWHRRGDPGE